MLLPISVIEKAYLAAKHPVDQLYDLTVELRHWHQAFPAYNYLQPCVIDDKASLICQRQLHQESPLAYQALTAICLQFGIFLKEDARVPGEETPVLVNRRSAAVILTFCLSFSPCVYAAKTISPPVASAALSVQMVSISIQNRTLSEMVNLIGSRSGIHFRLDPAVENDRLTGSLQSANWHDALASLLQAYNYSTIQENGQIKTVLVSGYRGGIKPDAPLRESQPEQTDIIFTTDSPSNVFIPINKLLNTPEGGNFSIELPVGVFEIKQESMVTSEDGTLSWVGIMEDHEQFYRLYLALRQDGEVIGNVVSPTGTYFIQTIDGQTLMVPADNLTMR